jgi:opacity protein-like surface antigen
MFTSELTLKRGDFAASSFGGDIGVRVSPRIDIVLNASHAKSSQLSEFRNWVDNNDQPIEQVTTFRRLPATLSARYFPMERGRAVGRHAWVPSSLLPYVGAGAGVVWYKLTQDGDFVDHETLDIFHDHLESSGSAGTAHVMAGAQWWPIARLGLTAEARYAWASATLKEGFSEFNSIDLKGFQWTAGVAARF